MHVRGTVQRMTQAMRTGTASPSLRSSIAANVRALMGRYQVTQQTLAGYMGVRRPSLSAKLNAQMAWKDEELEKVAEFFNIDPATLLDPNNRYYTDAPPPTSGTAEQLGLFERVGAARAAFVEAQHHHPAGRVGRRIVADGLWVSRKVA